MPAGKPKLGFVDFRFHQSFNSTALTRTMDQRKRGLLSRAGAYIRTAARGRLKRARQKSLGDMEPEERKSYRIRTRIARRQGRRKPRRPEAASKPGESPRLHMKRSPLKSLILYAYNPARDSVVVGPLKFGGRATAGILEYGGTARIRGKRRRVRARPFMRPALAKGLADLKRKTKTKLPKFWDNIVRS